MVGATRKGLTERRSPVSRHPTHLLTTIASDRKEPFMPRTPCGGKGSLPPSALAAFADLPRPTLFVMSYGHASSGKSAVLAHALTHGGRR